MVERVVEIAEACIRHLKKLGNNGTSAQKDAVSYSLCHLQRPCLPSTYTLTDYFLSSSTLHDAHRRPEVYPEIKCWKTYTISGSETTQSR